MMVLFLQEESLELIEYQYENFRKYFFEDLIESGAWLRDKVLSLTFFV